MPSIYQKNWSGIVIDTVAFEEERLTISSQVKISQIKKYFITDNSEKRVQQISFLPLVFLNVQ